MTFADKWGDGGYSAFLDSERWRWISEMVKARDRRCRACGGRADVVHHLCYCRGADTDAGHLTTLCFDCHELFHAHSRPACVTCGPSVQTVTNEPEPVAVVVAPRGLSDPEAEALRQEALAATDDATQVALLSRLHTRLRILKVGTPPEKRVGEVMPKFVNPNSPA